MLPTQETVIYYIDALMQGIQSGQQKTTFFMKRKD